MTRYILSFLNDQRPYNTLRKETERFGELQQAEVAAWQQKSQEVS